MVVPAAPVVPVGLDLQQEARQQRRRRRRGVVTIIVSYPVLSSSPYPRKVGGTRVWWVGGDSSELLSQAGFYCAVPRVNVKKVCGVAPDWGI